LCGSGNESIVARAGHGLVKLSSPPRAIDITNEPYVLERA
jgi:hypothetical protein